MLFDFQQRAAGQLLDEEYLCLARHDLHPRRRTHPPDCREYRAAVGGARSLGGPVRAVLEVVAGTAQKLGIAAGDRVAHPIFSRPLIRGNRADAPVKRNGAACWRKPNRVSRARAAQRRGIAQPGSAGVLGTPGRRFKSCCPDHRRGFDSEHKRQTMTARIYKPAKTAMQSGTAKTKDWVLDYEPEQPREIEPLMGWTSSGDMRAAGAAALRYARRRRSPIASGTASPIRSRAASGRRAARSPMPTILRSSAGIPGRTDWNRHVERIGQRVGAKRRKRSKNRGRVSRMRCSAKLLPSGPRLARPDDRLRGAQLIRDRCKGGLRNDPRDTPPRVLPLFLYQAPPDDASLHAGLRSTPAVHRCRRNLSLAEAREATPQSPRALTQSGCVRAWLSPIIRVVSAVSELCAALDACIRHVPRNDGELERQGRHGLRQPRATPPPRTLRHRS